MTYVVLGEEAGEGRAHDARDGGHCVRQSHQHTRKLKYKANRHIYTAGPDCSWEIYFSSPSFDRKVLGTSNTT